MFFNYGDTADWRNWALSFALVVVITGVAGYLLKVDQNSREIPPYWQECVHTTTGEAFTFNSSTAREYQNGIQVTDAEGWVRSIDHETNPDWKCRKIPNDE